MTAHLDVIGHRGLRRHAPENTIAAFEAAAELGVDGVEFDVQLTRDGVPVVLHDETVDRTTDGTGRVDGLTAAELARLDAGSWFSEGFRGEPVPTLADVLDWARTNTLTLHLELKDAPTMSGDGLVGAVAAAVEDAALWERTILSSYQHERLVEASRFRPGVRTAILFDFGLYEPWDYVRSVGAGAIHCRWDWVDVALVTAAQEQGIAVRAFGAGDPAALERVLCMAGADVITPEPAVALALRASAARGPGA